MKLEDTLYDIELDKKLKEFPPVIYGEKLNYELQISKNGLSEFYWCGYYDSQDNMLLGTRSKKLSDALAQLLILMIEKGYMNVEED